MVSFKQKSIILTTMLSATLLQSQLAFAHITSAPHDHNSFFSGFLHPLSGLDHILVMVAVGLWAAQLGGKALWAVPSAFVLAMALGYGLALSHVDLPFVEPAILASTVAIGLLAAIALRVPTAIAVVIVGAFAVFHGAAHGAEIGTATAAAYGLGFALATALLHMAGLAIGLGAGLFFGEYSSKTATRIGGALTALAGLYLSFMA
ncbi:HupE/UreJ family protein [Bartonella sp. HY329]|uniref:HupE/UreJ family protein n=1 Tax=unclassified Bartonella TaxID=2645622 RepID=UPI0021C7EA8C|nr:MULTISPECIES: HupE/UreJ family protein [unclassified Bartonella]UXM95800.1 HupE/UreJ family protein [Bartonella sp. HY329]UXN10125.1 HupE/UreJ family protein [Bartonella sp. HY328]